DLRPKRAEERLHLLPRPLDRAGEDAGGITHDGLPEAHERGIGLGVIAEHDDAFGPRLLRRDAEDGGLPEPTRPDEEEPTALLHRPHDRSDLVLPVYQFGATELPAEL